MQFIIFQFDKMPQKLDLGGKKRKKRQAPKKPQDEIGQTQIWYCQNKDIQTKAVFDVTLKEISSFDLKTIKTKKFNVETKDKQKFVGVISYYANG